MKEELEFKAGEFVTALPNHTYGYTNHGWTAPVMRQTDGFLEVAGYGRGINNRMVDHWFVETELFIPYSENMETAGFERFVIHGKEGDEDETGF